MAEDDTTIHNGIIPPPAIAAAEAQDHAEEEEEDVHAACTNTAITATTTIIQTSSTDFSKPPWVEVPGVANFRDVGGWGIVKSSPRKNNPTSSTTGENGNGNGGNVQRGRVRRGMVYRSAEPSRITEEGKKKIQELGIRKMYDLRSEAELGRLGEMAKVVSVEGVERIFAPVIREEDYSPEALAIRYEQYMTGNLQSAYRAIIPSSTTSYRQIFQHLLSSPTPAPILIHCTAGKDRTGIISAMILLLAGVPDEVIAREYELTAQGLEGMKEKIINYLMKDEKSMAGGGRERAENMLSSTRNTMLRFLDILRDEFGGVEGYLTNLCGFSEEEVERLKKVVVEEDKAPLFDETGTLIYPVREESN